MLKQIGFVFAALLLSVNAYSAHCLFTPPEKWEFADPTYLSPRVVVGFIGELRKNFRPSLNLSIEDGVEVEIGEYLKSVKALHEKEPGRRWRDLGSFSTLAGQAHLTSLDTKAKNGEARLLQLILLRDKKAYTLTAAVSKEEFFDYYKDFEKTFRSVRLVDDLLDSLQDPSKKEACILAKNQLRKQWNDSREKFSSSETHFTDQTFQKEVWIPFQQRIANETSEWGPYGQLAFLLETQQELFN
ncbi:MAG: hypothetical protein HYX48_06165 [Chlamydiales bacterium]|nr:hypothetical protein [Chlamydiales bacterium]